MTHAIDEKTLTVLFAAREARDVAQSLLEQTIGSRAVIVSPKTHRPLIRDSLSVADYFVNNYTPAIRISTALFIRSP